jgi:diguanylate cyclase (GGDEF)-like protein
MEREGPAKPRDTEGARRLFATLRIRIAAAVAVSAAAALVADRTVTSFGTALPPVARLVLALVVAGSVGFGLVGRAVAPLTASRDDLHERYEAALVESLTDPLTRLGNHRAFQEELERQTEEALRYETPLALVMIDLDEFKTVNDTRGHATGDRTLAAFGKLLDTSVRKPDRGFRVGGDEFAILLPHTDAQGAWIVARRLLGAALSPPLREDGAESVSFSAGVSCAPGLASSRAQLYSQADTALYAAKRAGRTDVRIFDPTVAGEPIAVESSAAIADIIAQGRLRPVYQPIVSLEDNRVIGMEGLIRPVEPAPFEDPLSMLSAAEATGHIVALDLACLETVVGGAVNLPEDAFLSVNISPRTIEAPEFGAATLLAILARHSFPATRVVLELTEHQAIEDLARVRNRLEGCRRAGIRLAVDDLGAGNAGLRLLSEIRFDVLKVDLSLVQRSAATGPSAEVLSSVVGLAGRTGALVVAEGVERPEQLEQLTTLGVAAAQGYLLGRPEPMAQPASAARARLRLEPIAREFGLRRDVEAASMTPGMASWRQSIGLPT